MEHVNLGDEVKDIVTGFKGIATGRSQWLQGCDHILVQPPVNKKGEARDGKWFDEPQCKVLKRAKVKPTLTLRQRKTGGPMLSPPDRGTH